MIKVNVSLDDNLVRRMDEYAENNYLKRSSLVSLALTQFLNANDVANAIIEMSLCMRKIADSGEIDDSTLEQLEDFERLSKIIASSKLC